MTTITSIFGTVTRTFIKPCKKQPTVCRIKICNECCAVRENENLFSIAFRRDLMPSLAFLDQFVTAYEARRASVPLVNIGKTGPKTEKWAFLLRRRGT